MTRFLLAVSIGPVQDFIAAGRRTGDLYAGSKLIGEIAKRAASGLQSAGAQLIYPASLDNDVPNKLLARTDVEYPERAAQEAESAARGFLREAWDQVARKAPAGSINLSLAEQQIGSFLEFFCAWYPWDGQDASYRRARSEVEHLLAGRKALRDFVQPPKHCVAKSPLDPSRDSVVQGDMSVKPWRLKEGECLDAVSVLKRARGADTKAPSTADIAARTFLAQRPDLAAELGDFPGAVYGPRRGELVQDGKLGEDRAKRIDEKLGHFEVPAYFAILQADGDKVGRHLSRLATSNAHAAFSKALAEFSEAARRVVNTANGHVVYSGGDDVLAFLPVHTAIPCAAALAQEFNTRTSCTLSVGMAIVHYHEPLYITLGYARDAEKRAKSSGGDRLCLAMHVRGGQTKFAEHSWSVGFELTEWRRWTDAFRSGLSRGFPYELNQLARDFEGAEQAEASIVPEIERIYRRKIETEGKQSMGDITDLVQGVASARDLMELADRLILFRRLAAYPMEWRSEEP